MLSNSNVATGTIIIITAEDRVTHDRAGRDDRVRTGGDRTHLINFDTTIVRPDLTSGKLEFRDTGRFAGNCTLTCHGDRHVNEDYHP